MSGVVRPSKIIQYPDKGIAEIVITNKSGVEKERAIIDIIDVQKIKNYRWCTTEKHYVGTSIEENRKYKRYGLHNILIQEKMVDHINQNPLDNRKINLRPTDFAQNRVNSKLGKNNTNGVQGIIKRKGRKTIRWEASIRVNGKKLYLTETEDKEKAIQARKEAEKKYYSVVRV